MSSKQEVIDVALKKLINSAGCYGNDVSFYVVHNVLIHVYDMGIVAGAKLAQKAVTDVYLNAEEKKTLL